MGGARTGGGDKPSIAPEKTLGRGPICSAAFSLRKPPRNSLILRHGVLTKLPLSRPPRCVAAAPKSSAPLTRPSPQVSHPIPPRTPPVALSSASPRLSALQPSPGLLPPSPA